MLRILHVVSLGLSSDAAQPVALQPFHLTISSEFRERVANPDELIILPTLDGLQITGDERRAVHTRGGTKYTETLSVVAPLPGIVHVGSAYLDAIDARSRKPSRFSSNDLRLDVRAAGNGEALRTLSLAISKVALLALTLFAAALLLRVWSRKTERSPVVTDVPVQDKKATGNVEPDSLGDAVACLKRTRSRAAVVRVRDIVRASFGAKDGETLHDLLRRDAAASVSGQTLLQATERAAFIGEGHFQAAMDELIRALEHYAA